MGESDEYNKRKQLDFAQAEGMKPLPSQMNRYEITPSFRAKLWNYIVSKITYTYVVGNYYFNEPWDFIIRDMWVNHSHLFIDQYKGDDASEVFSRYVRPLFVSGTYLEFFGALQYIIRHPRCENRFKVGLQELLASERAAYRIVNGDTFVPFSSDEEIQAVERGFTDTGQASLIGAQTHLRKAAVAASNGLFSDSVRESIHAVESVARSLAPSGKLSAALAALESKGVIHNAMKSGFGSLYGYTSDEEGIRHPLLESTSSPVNEADALFMLGACSAFVSYMINRAREAGLTMNPSS